jgi:hypothetical protein
LGNTSLGAVLLACPSIETLSLQDAAITDPTTMRHALEDAATAPRLRDLYLGANSWRGAERALESLRAVAATRGLNLLNLDVEHETCR